jgi:CheY-like chemotaxis protein
MEPRILLVEDNAVNQLIAQRILQKSGYESEVAQDGKEAIEILSRKTFELILMDVQMPGMDGFEATRIIRNPGSGVLDHNVPIIAMTAYADKENRDKCKEAGMTDYLSKPIDMERFISLVRYYLDTNRPSTE